MRVFVNDVAVFKCARLRFVGVANQIHWPLFFRLDEGPLQATRKSRSAASAQARVLDFVDDVTARHLQRLPQLRITAVTQVTIDVGRPIRASDVFVNQAVLERVRGCLMFDVRCLMSDDIPNRIWIDLLVQLFADHAYGRGATACQAFDKLNAVVSIRTDSNGFMNTFAVRRALNFKRRTQIFHHLEPAGHCATERAADANMSFASRFLAKHWIKRDHLKNVDGLQTKLASYPQHGLVADEPEVFLPQVQ